MAKCGVRFRYPVKILIVDEEGPSGEGPIIGDAETLREALSLAERQGFRVRDADDGGTSKFVVKSTDRQTYFLVTVYPA
jgi:hypothetical protein